MAMLGRSYVVKGFIALLALSLAAGIACGQATGQSQATPPPQSLSSANLEEQVEQFYSPLSNVPVVFESKSLEKSTSFLDKQRLFRQVPPRLAAVYNEMARQGYAEKPDGVSQLVVTSIDPYFVLAEQDSLEGKVETANKAIAHMQGYISDARLQLPQVVFKIPKSSTEARSAFEAKISGEVNTVTAYVFKNFTRKATLKGKMKYGELTVPLELSFPLYESAGGAQRLLTIKSAGKGFQASFSYYSIVWALDHTAQVVFETPALEALHVAVAPITEKISNEQLKFARSRDEAQSIVEEYVRLEEYVVHGIGMAWFEKLNNDWQLGFDTNELKRTSEGFWWRVENVQRVAALVQRKGPAAVIEMYQKAPPQLISEAGIR